jgi:hypothetical protein
MRLELSLTIDPTDYRKLTTGENIAIVFRPFPIGRKFALAPLINSFNSEKVEFFTNTYVEVVDKEVISQDIIDHDLAKLLNMTLEELQANLNTSDTFLLMYFRAYRFEPQIKVFTSNQINFLPLPQVTEINNPVSLFSDHLFQKRKQEIKSRQPYEHSKLENLQISLNQLSVTNPLAQILNQQIQMFLGYPDTKPANPNNQDLSWVSTISTLGDRSIEKDEGKSSYQAGTDFENIVKDSLAFLGFTIDEAYKGGAGGLDLFCSKPYPLTGECKAGKSIPNRTVEELIRLGGTHLSVEGFINLSAKLVICAGNPTNPMLDAAYQWQVSIIKAMTLQKLVELKAKYNGAINLFELKEYLQAGQIDDKIHEYIQKVESEIKLRAHIVEIIKNFLQNNALPNVDINVIFGIYGSSNSPQKLSLEELRDLLIELSSPLAGYLGRVERDGKRCDQFYYLRDLAGDE